ncbi:hypothetical protein [Acinetobacter baumannii]|uniref:hypothetical protein n=1 Tax=Acinetobacter baumannii TaxID=470 RepID=UPI003AF5534F
MKKIYLYFFYALVIFYFCFIISYIIKKQFDIDGDYLSAFATFIAALVAANLFNDWREKHKVEWFERLKDKINQFYTSFESSYSEFLTVLIRRKYQDSSEELNLVTKNLLVELENLTNELDFYEKLLVKFKIDISKLQVHPKEAKEHLEIFYMSLIETFRTENYEINFQTYEEMLINSKHSYLFKIDKIMINKDIQDLILRLYDEK